MIYKEFRVYMKNSEMILARVVRRIHSPGTRAEMVGASFANLTAFKPFLKRPKDCMPAQTQFTDSKVEEVYPSFASP